MVTLIFWPTFKTSTKEKLKNVTRKQEYNKKKFKTREKNYDCCLMIIRK